MVSDGDEYVEKETITQVGKKRGRGSRQATRPAEKASATKRGRKDIDSTSVDKHASPKDRAHPLPLPFPVSPATENVNRFMKLYNKYNFEDKDGYQYGARPEAVHIQQRKIMPGRNYEFNVKALCKVQAVYPSTYEVNDKSYPDGNITYWRIEALDPNNKKQAFRTLRLFEMPDHGKRRTDKTLPFPPVGAITTAISDDEDQVIELGQIACEILNKAPIEIDWINDSGVVTMPPFQRFVERTALSIWRRDVDFTLMPPVYFTGNFAESGKRRSVTTDFYATTSSTPPGSDTANVSFTLTIQDTGIQELGTKGTQLTTSFTLSHIRSDACDSQQSCPETSCYRVAYNGTKQNTKDSAIATKIDAVNRLANKTLYEMQGFVGTSAQLMKLFRTTIAQYGVGSKMGVQGRGILVVDGVLDASRVFGSTLANDGATITWLSRSVLEFFSKKSKLDDSDMNTFNKMF